MGKHNKQERKKRTKWDERSDKRSAEYILRRMDTIKEDLGDLIAEFKAFDQYDHVLLGAHCIRIMDGMRQKYRKIADGQPWQEAD